MSVKFQKNCENTVKILKIFPKDVFLWSLAFIFLGSHKKFSLVLLHIQRN